MNRELNIMDSNNIQNRIFTIRGLQVMVDRDLAELYQVETKVLNQAVKRNIERFPEQFRFQLSKAEKNELVTNCDRFESLKHSTVLPYVFTEQGVSMLSAVLRSKTAIKVSIQIMDAFVGMRKFIAGNAAIFQRLDNIEQKQHLTDTKLDKVFEAIEAKDIKPEQGIFFDGQVFGVNVLTINEHIKNIFATGELDEVSTIRKFRIVRQEGKREVARNIDHYNLDMMISVGYRVNSKTATKFRKWATTRDCPYRMGM